MHLRFAKHKSIHSDKTDTDSLNILNLTFILNHCHFSLRTRKELFPDVRQEHLEGVFKSYSQSIIADDPTIVRCQDYSTKFLVRHTVIFIYNKLALNRAHFAELLLTMLRDSLDNSQVLPQTLNFNLFLKELDHTLDHKFFE